VGVEKLHFSQNGENLGDRKCPGKPRKSFVGLPKRKGFLTRVERSSFSTPTPDYVKNSPLVF
jgi:hypothetical protein